MKLTLSRNQDGMYELLWGKTVLTTSAVLTQAVSAGQQYAKNFRKKLYIGASCLADWYVGFPVDKEQPATVFRDEFFQHVESSASPYRFVEGPFVTQQLAEEAAFKISGKTSVLKE